MKRVRVKEKPVVDVAMHEIEARTEIEDKPLRTSSARLCQFCKHPYLNPCTEKKKDDCRNYQFIISQKKAKP